MTTRIRLDRIWIAVALCATSAAAQTPVTNSNNGTTNAVPVYIGSATLGNSPITVSGSNVGIGTTTPPTSPLVVSDTNGAISFDPRIISTYAGYNEWAINSGSSYYSLIDFKRGGNDVVRIGAPLDRFAVSTGNPYVENFTILPSGNVGIGTTSPGAKLEVYGNLKLTANSGGSITFQDGTTQSTAYTGVTCGGDYAESVDVTGKRTSYEPGDVLVIDANAPGRFLKSAEPYSTLVTGIYSTKPGTVGRRQTTAKSPDEVPMAMMGIVPAKVSAENGAVKLGDLLVSSSKPGYAMKGTDRSRMLGSVIGKAMGKLDSDTGVIEVLVTLQ